MLQDRPDCAVGRDERTRTWVSPLDKKQAWLMAFEYWEQSMTGFGNFLEMYKLATYLNRDVIVPFVDNSFYVGYAAEYSGGRLVASNRCPYDLTAYYDWDTLQTDVPKQGPKLLSLSHPKDLRIDVGSVLGWAGWKGDYSVQMRGEPEGLRACRLVEGGRRCKDR